MKKILCPTDFSEAANGGVLYAAKFAKATGATLTLYHVQSLFNFSALELIGGKETSFASVSRELELQSREVSRIFKISCYAETETSIAPLTRVLQDKEHEFDLIVMGAAGFDDLMHFFTGSTIYKTIRKANVPVIIVPDGCLYSAVDKVVFAYNYVEEKALPMEQLTPWMVPLQSKLTVMEVHQPMQKEADENEDFRAKKLVRLLNKQLLMDFDILYSTNIAEGIDHYMHDKSADMLVLSSRHRTFVDDFFRRSVIHSITNKATYPVFIIHE
jgi:nucleotide-binding universal stress UspA family protein